MPPNVSKTKPFSDMILSEVSLENERLTPIRSGFRSAKLNAFGASKGLMCAGNAKNYAYHIWDHRDENGHAGAAACIVIPRFNAGDTHLETWQELAHKKPIFNLMLIRVI
ncbi:MAG: hypothetical protein ACSHXB_04385 [Sulfitobacter sp.]